MKNPVKALVPVLIRMPPALLKRLDSAASVQRRSRAAEVCLRLEQSLKLKAVTEQA
ncbi:MAG: hypothetical protein ABL896_16120 [Hylemonella sp.]